VLAEGLRTRGYQVLVAPSPDAALELARVEAGPIHLFLVDLVMPGMGGRTLARELARLRPEAELLFMSGYAEEEPGRVASAERLLAKPFSLADLGRAVREVLDRPPDHA
jgi:CheY-like chemotaxis protein